MAEKDSKYVLYVHFDSEIKTVKAFLSGSKAITGMPQSDFLKYSPTELKRISPSKTKVVTIDGKKALQSIGNQDKFEPSNLERIYNMYDPDEKKKYNTAYDKALSIITSGSSTAISWSGPLKINTQLAVPSDKLRREIVAMKGQNIVSTERSTTAFVGNRLESLLRDPGYKRYSNASHGAFKKEHPTVSVWIWIRALSDGPLSGDLEGTILDISNYIETCQTHVSENGGNFTITLPPLMAKFYPEDKSNKNGMWGIDDKSILRKADERYVSKGSMNRVEKGLLKRNNFFLHTAINKNDVVWIRMETLETEVEDRSLQSDGDVVSKNELPGKIYDMIGLVDTCTQVSNFEATDVVTTINGRDLTKLVIDDGAYLQPILFFKDNFLGVEGQIIQRNAFDTAFADLSFARYNTIEEAMTFLINVVANIEVVPDSLFAAYTNPSRGVEITKGLTDKQIKARTKLEFEARSNIRSAREKRLIPLPLSGADQSLLWNKILDFAKEIDNSSPKKKIVTWDSYKGKFPTLIDPTRVGTEITTKTSSSGIQVESILNVDISGNKVPYIALAVVAALNYVALEKTQKPVPVIKPQERGIWQIIELVIDEGVRHRTIADTSLSQPDGAIINQFFKYCQKPFVEFYTDTYGDKFNFIVREPPFDQARIVDFINSGLMNGLTIDDADVINENFSFSSTAYSWYEVDPQSVNFGQTDSIYSKIPIVVFDEFAKIFGSSKLTVVSNYISWFAKVHENQDDDSNYLLEQVLIDLKYLIDCHAYLPFTREGTIVINGDRRFKRGTWMRYRPTGEIFYIDEVTNDYMHTGETIDRVTLLKVSRGMVEEYVDGSKVINLSDGGQVPLTYFNLIDTKLLLEYAREKLAIDGKKKPTINPKTVNKVNKEVFNFFMKRLQFASGGIASLDGLGVPLDDGSKFNNYV